HAATLKTYIVHVEPCVETQDLESWYDSFIPESNPSTESGSRIIYRYRHIFSGFAARLTPEEVKVMEGKKGFISAAEERVLQLHTTHTPSFLGLGRNLGFWNESSYGEGVVIGLLDTGINADHPSFSDEGVPPPPKKWKGRCELGGGVCNRKLIGARAFGVGSGLTNTPADEQGHGTHTSSTAAGNFVPGANFLGSANGTSIGIAPRAHIAMYRVCFTDGCQESDIAAGLDAAIDDGVDILSISLGGNSAVYDVDPIAIGSFRAVEKGIFVSCSAGNSGPTTQSLSNEAPWILTVGASTTDRKLVATAVLGSGVELVGESGFQTDSTADLPLINPSTSGGFSFCGPDDLGPTSNVEGKIVICQVGGNIQSVDKGEYVRQAGGKGMILVNSEIAAYTLFDYAHVIPATHVSYEDSLKIEGYLNSTSNPTARIVFEGTKMGDKFAPFLAFFSSRGPGKQSPGILKPDIIGPGVNILAGWHESVRKDTNTTPFYNIISGTSMSCPHLAGVVALLKSAHPDWSPAAIKSAIMTTADQLNLGGDPILDERHLPPPPFSVGSGHVNPSKASDPGLVYDLSTEDYVPYLCGLNYTADAIQKIVQRRVSCANAISEAELNYPSFTVAVGSAPATYSRTVTNVGEGKASYTVEIGAPDGVSVVVTPETLDFMEIGQKLNYSVTFSSSGGSSGGAGYSQGFISWNSGKYSVRSPIVAAI
ncbi:serine protease, partial [Genlisea aurea]